jgi:hypothetical protein
VFARSSSDDMAMEDGDEWRRQAKPRLHVTTRPKSRFLRSEIDHATRSAMRFLGRFRMSVLSSKRVLFKCGGNADVVDAVVDGDGDVVEGVC